nr:MAG TPA: hypothetical protein [Caudoviricetes sp.]
MIKSYASCRGRPHGTDSARWGPPSSATCASGAWPRSYSESTTRSGLIRWRR